MKFKISKPVVPFVILQKFGGNGSFYQKNGINIAGHNGIDLRTFHGQPIYASHDGTALYQVDANQGHGVVVITKDSYEYDGRETPMKTIYWHICDPIKEPKFKSPIADKGAVDVREGDLIGYANSTGFSTGDHLHFAVKPLAKVGENLYTWGPVDPKNGYNGCVDPMPYFDDVVENTQEEIKAKIEFTQLTLIEVLKQYIAYLRGKR